MMLEFIDGFCGFGGITEGIEQARVNGRRVAKTIAGINHDAMAIKCFKANHPGVKCFTEDFTQINPVLLPPYTEGAYRFFHISAECTNFSIAKGGLSRDADSRTLPEDILRYIDYYDRINQSLHYITVENVKEFLENGPLMVKVKRTDEGFEYCPLQYSKKKKKLEAVYVPDPLRKKEYYVRWVNDIKARGYECGYRIINAADMGEHTSRRRLCIIFARMGLPIAFPKPTHAKNPVRGSGLKKWKAVKHCLDFSDKGDNILLRKKPLAEPSLKRVYKGCIKHIAGGEEAFIKKNMSNNAVTKSNSGASINEPSPAITTGVFMDLVQAERMDKSFLAQYNGGSDENRVISINSPANTVSTANRFALVQPEFMIKYYGTGKNVTGLEAPSPTLATKDKLAIISTERFINIEHSEGKQSQPVEEPCGSLLQHPKQKLVTAEKAFVVNTNYNNQPTSVNEPHPVVTADRHYPYLVQTEAGNLAIEIYPDDSEYTVLIKQFMALYGIVAIYMRMLKISELLLIQGFSKNYKLHGTKTEQKKFIGNSVPPKWFKAVVEALALALLDYEQMKEAA